MYSLGQCATLACLWEATAPKPGNVHRGADFETLSFFDFVTSAVVIGPIMEQAGAQPLGRTIFEAVQATRAAVHTNTNLGTVLLLAPLAKVPRSQSLGGGVADVLASLTPADSEWVYEAIRTAAAGGLGQVNEFDIRGEPPPRLLAAMALAAPRDLVARQYVEQFDTVLNRVVPEILAGRERGWSLSDTIIQTQLRLLGDFPDSLIARKCGEPTAQQASAMALSVLSAGEPADENYEHALADFDFWLRSDGHRRNPGTTADLIAAGLFAALRDGLL
ncbi:MAG TPA: triphosphoribosyl-dephospho-CoA synthase [Pirellulales bacterium]|jgi:triphosphoribosyl-dephospho-CoA synthase|nr:triphosphoribosyl-dephospho-CoA synthase [Pirellulales bacterium]